MKFIKTILDDGKYRVAGRIGSDVSFVNVHTGGKIAGRIDSVLTARDGSGKINLVDGEVLR